MTGAAEVADPERTHYRFSISLRIVHPSLAPEEITRSIGVEPKRCWTAGTPRSTPAGASLRGRYSDTYWTGVVAAGRWPTTLNEVVEDRLLWLAPRRTFLRRIRAEGGAAELFIGWFFENQGGDLLDHRCLALAGDLQVDLHFDVYAPSEPHDQEIDADTLPSPP